MDFAKFAKFNLYGSHTCPSVADTSVATLITPAIIQHFTYGNWKGTMEIQDCLSELFRLLSINPSISLLQHHEIDQMLYQGEAPHRWKN